MRIIIVLILLSVTSGNLLTQQKGSIFSYDDETEVMQNRSDVDWYIDLVPNQSYTGWWYFSASSTPVTANLQENPSAGWLSVNPTAFTSNSCSDVKPIAFTFTAPSAPGSYFVTIIDANNNWASTNIYLTVTYSPVNNSTDSLVTGYTGQNTLRYQTSDYFPFNQGCNPSFIPGPTRQTIHTLISSIGNMSINPSNFTININNSLTAVKTFYSGTPGTFYFLELRTRQWSTNPLYIYWTYNAIPPNSINKISEIIPDNYSLNQNYPNPFNPVTNIEFSISKPGNVRIIIYDISGREISVLADEHLGTGIYRAVWEANNYPSGAYFYKMITEGFSETKKMILIK